MLKKFINDYNASCEKYYGYRSSVYVQDDTIKFGRIKIVSVPKFVLAFALVFALEMFIIYICSEEKANA